MMSRIQRQQSGIALIVVLWALALLTALAASVTFTQRTEVQLNRSLLAQVEARQLARAGVHFAVYMLQLTDQGQAWEVDGESRPFRFGDHVIWVAVFEEQGLIDVNRAGPDLLAKAFAAVGLEVATADALLDIIEDWKDEDDVHRLHGAETPEYRTAGYTYGPVNGPFRDLSELRLVYGMNADLFLRLRDLLTVDSGRSAVKLTASPPAVRQLLSDDLTATVDSARPVGRARLPGRGKGGFTGGIRERGRGGLRVQVEIPLAQGGRYVTAATVVLDNRAASGFRIVKWHEVGVGPSQYITDSGSSG
jgi:general secretion pathway protein K